MNHTHFDDDYRQVVKQRVISYDSQPGGGYIQLFKDFDLHGDGNLLTTVEDLQRWDENFYSGKVGGSEFLKLQLTKGVLSNKDSISYALGLSHGMYKGLPTISHTGGFKGFRTQLVRFPQQHFSVIVLCNLGSINPSGIANKVTDIYLANQFKIPTNKPQKAVTQKEVKIAPTIFDAYIGSYELAEQPGFILSFKQ